MTTTQQLAKEQLLKNPLTHWAFAMLKQIGLLKQQEQEFDNSPIGEWLDALISPSEDSQDAPKIVQQTAGRMLEQLSGFVEAVQIV